ncbi:basic salivary proline-rich protein 3-like [Accipiter gentilis]|uniref:basic salivary proline-rich protein 3-like n=1 Tax=Astur gentilis TaxID=8957 RepID=UPI00210F5CDC|nr:basic salivary proline-rich protein 3-like [Accipiter gentilis]
MPPPAARGEAAGCPPPAHGEERGSRCPPAARGERSPRRPAQGDGCPQDGGGSRGKPPPAGAGGRMPPRWRRRSLGLKVGRRQGPPPGKFVRNCGPRKGLVPQKLVENRVLWEEPHAGAGEERGGGGGGRSGRDKGWRAACQAVNRRSPAPPAGGALLNRK